MAATHPWFGIARVLEEVVNDVVDEICNVSGSDINEAIRLKRDFEAQISPFHFSSHRLRE